MKAGWHGPTPERLALAEQVAALRAEGLFWRQIATRLGISRSYAQDLGVDPDGRLARQRKDSYARPCMDCGAPTSGGEGRKSEPRCQDCANRLNGVKATVWTRDRIIGAIRWWADSYGDPPAVPDWSPTTARYLGDEARALRFERHHDAGQVPWFMTVVRMFLSWNAAIEAAGFVPRQPNGGGGNQLRRRRMRERTEA